MNNKERFESIAREQIKRDGIENLLECLAKSDFYTAPASTKYHDSEEGGLVKHSLDVYDNLCIEVRNTYDAEREYQLLETISIVSLFHDICKMNFYEVSTKPVKIKDAEQVNGRWQTAVWEDQPYYKINDLFPFGHGEKSVCILQTEMKLTVEEMIAIRFHMGGFVPKDEYMYLNKAYDITPLAVLLHVADMKATYKINA